MSETDTSRIFLPSRVRLLFLIVAVLAYVLTELGRFELRPYVQETGFNDFGISRIIGNGGGILVQIFLALAIINPRPKRSYYLALFFIGGYILYEFAQPFLPKGTFDWNDILATVVGGAIGIGILKLIWNRIPPENK